MKRKAFTIIELLAVLIILGIIGTVAVLSYTRYISSSKTANYDQGEETLRAGAESFMTYCNTSTFNLPASCPVVPDSGSSVRVEMSDIINEGFMDPVVDQENGGTCSGYVVIHNKSAAGDPNYDFCYEVHLECSEYQTDANEWKCD